MALKKVAGHLIETDPEPGFMITVREWDSLINRVKRLADPLENAHAWMRMCLGIAAGTLTGVVLFPGYGEHPVRSTLLTATFLTFAVLTLFFWRLGLLQVARRPENVEGITADMERTRDEKAPHAKKDAS